MKILFIIPFLVLIVLTATSQQLSASNLLKWISLSEKKMEFQLKNNEYHRSGTNFLTETTIKVYTGRQQFPNNNSPKADSTRRYVLITKYKDIISLTYQTTAIAEFKHMLADLKKADFYTYSKNDAPVVAGADSILYQHEEYTATAYATTDDSLPLYSILYSRKNFSKANEIYYGEDLLQFSSHEYLVHYFGEENVKKDIYFFSGNEIANCSVLFINTNRQVIFIWADEFNKRSISNLLFGGQQKLKSQIDYNKYVAENNWMLKSGVHAGMSIYELRKINENNFNFYGGSNINSGLILDEINGKIDFKKESIILGCMNCTDNAYGSSVVITADDAIADGRILFVLSVVLYP